MKLGWDSGGTSVPIEGFDSILSEWGGGGKVGDYHAG